MIFKKSVWATKSFSASSIIVSITFSEIGSRVPMILFSHSFERRETEPQNAIRTSDKIPL